LRHGVPVAVIRFFGKAILIAVPLTITLARLHAYTAKAPTEVTGEVTRCLSVVRVAATRRGRRPAAPQPGRAVTAERFVGRVAVDPAGSIPSPEC